LHTITARSTVYLLLPYTTLFRSSSIRLKFILFFVLLILIAMQIIGVYFVRELELKLTANFKESILNRVNLLKYNIEQELLIERKDRKSTRLNSSHVKISYADFCV